MKSLPRILKLALFILAIPAVSAAAGRECINWPKIMSQQAIGGATSGKIVVAESFTDYTKVAGDDWLSAGLRDLIATMVAQSKSVRVFAGSNAVYNPDAKNPAFIISGMFQHLEGGLRIFVKLMKGEDKSLVSQYEVLVPYPESSEIFTRFTDVARQIWATIQAGGDESRLAMVRDATPSTRAYESYVKGRQALETYKMADMEVAKTWFEQAKRNDYRSPLGYQGMIDLYTFLGFYHKQRHEPFGSYFQQAEQELANMTRLAKRLPLVVLMAKKPTKKEQETVKLANRFLLDHASFNEGLIAAEAGNWKAAAEAFQSAVDYVPEDAIAWYHLARAYENLGNAAESSKALQKAYEVNPCVEK